ncbi:MAG TPA: SufD family Fe-S cluster assembly protein, partial [Pseudomonadales bacterium]|nr:SufD family Fe-S cluster assembly protein [Pseudomonadales bacterium]
MQRDVDTLPWLADINDKGREIWRSSAMPGRKTEAWRYTPVRALERNAWLAAPGPVEQGENLARMFHIDALDAAAVVFVNGQYSAALSAARLPGGIEMVRFAEASDAEAREIRHHLGGVVDDTQHMFAALNDSWLADGVFLRVGTNAVVSTPIQVVWLTLPEEQGFAVSQRLLVVMEANSEATLVEHFASSADEQNAFTNGVTELVVGEGARLHHYRLQLEEEHALHIGGVHVNLAC